MATRSACRKALAHLKKQEWQAAHAIVQSLDAPLAPHIHALAHRLEGDLGNARYWYRRAHVRYDDSLEIDAEIEAIAATLEPQPAR